MPIPESKFKNKVISCTGFDCPSKLTCKLWHNQNVPNVWEKIRPPMRKGEQCPKYRQL